MTDAENRDKVIRGLKACNRQSYNGSDCKNCPYYDDEDTAELPFGICSIQDMFDDALALLKEQEARVLEFLEISETTTYWMENNHEANRKTSCIPETIMDIMGDRVFTIPVVKLLNGYAPVISKNREGYGKTWRAWTSRPTPEQMRETPWEEK